ncbi:hypothetical protein Poli38472_003800 [Pythium oligandrum]|uniref:Poly(A)-specific ribonuclease PARN n=1 Tax=Pythium oligandrum TaxID=41045 RepID=A0A8K1CNV2_PYTOL|nr:hypothetical protein Poli38472_003800 [Pythium oligandrum]|eukprot:TMW66035.1 hypothetical protein Poli38472_003800 [Pythium oligandrum]
MLARRARRLSLLDVRSASTRRVLGSTVSAASPASLSSAFRRLDISGARALTTLTTTTTHLPSPQLGEMNVTRHNFKDCFADLKKDIELPTCRFIAIDTEFTGLSPNDHERETFIDTLEERYRKVKRAGESFLITQFGLSTVHVDDEHKFLIKTWNFYVFPRPYGQSDERFLCQASSLQFLSEHGFDFNKFIGEGIPFINLAKAEVMRERLEKRIDNLNKPNKAMTLSEDGLEFQKEVKEKLEEWLDSGDARKGVNLIVPARNSFYKLVVHETVREKANYLYSESVSEGVEVRFVTNKVKEELLAARAKTMRQELDEAIGFSRVIELISDSKKPVVGHNALLDFVYVFSQFYKPLPDTLAEFKQQLVELFPTIYDTKHATLRSPLGAKLSSTSLSSLFEYMGANVKPTPENLLSSDPKFEGYRSALKAESDANEKLLCHEAGFDAFMTGVCFLGLLAHDANGDLVDDAFVGDSKFLEKRLEEMDVYKNRLNLMISDEPHLDLTNLEQKIDRSHVYRVSTTDRKRRIQHVKLEDLFAQPSKINRVVRDTDRDAFVFLAEATPLKDETTPAEHGVTVTQFDEYMDLKTSALSARRAARYSPPSSPKAKSAQTDAEEPSWYRCTIS